MVYYCAAYNCRNTSVKGCGVTFHQFPRNEEIKQKWVTAMKKKNFNPTKHSRLCSKHFTEDCYQLRPGASYNYLKDDAVPSIFDIPGETSKGSTQNDQVRIVEPSIKIDTDSNDEDLVCLAKTVMGDVTTVMANPLDIINRGANSPVRQGQKSPKVDTNEEPIDLASKREYEDEEDECDLFGKLLAKKLKKIPEEEREYVMYEIEGVLINRRLHSSSHQGMNGSNSM